MALSLKDAETDHLAREVAKLTGESLTEAVRKALAERLERERRRRGRNKSLAERLDDRVALRLSAGLRHAQP
jgi:antitoxin VapB